MSCRYNGHRELLLKNGEKAQIASFEFSENGYSFSVEQYPISGHRLGFRMRECYFSFSSDAIQMEKLTLSLVNHHFLQEWVFFEHARLITLLESFMIDLWMANHLLGVQDATHGLALLPDYVPLYLKDTRTPKVGWQSITEMKGFPWVKTKEGFDFCMNLNGHRVQSDGAERPVISFTPKAQVLMFDQCPLAVLDEGKVKFWVNSSMFPNTYQYRLTGPAPYLYVHKSGVYREI